ncbi:glycoside hydrolase family 65 protein [Indiicoccus explosivorum]|uniref:glycoside hydrolase family 65 protein n=1 Tax=Indiicoccus explosivorum TaxID=1917864 RepID=UPI000B43B37B|nr:glycosyl hydrolase family 65 protein [Indiicoccus explosivorum]
MMDYGQGSGPLKNWIVAEKGFSTAHLGKSEAILSLGNGYLGLRSATEEPYLGEKRNLFVNGTFNQAAPNEVTELPNMADVTRIDIRVDGGRFSLELGGTETYIRQLNLKTAELQRTVDWTSPGGKKFRFRFRRFVSLQSLHLIGMKWEAESLTHPAEVAFDSGIDAQQSNSGAQHFLEGERRVFGDSMLQLVQRTGQSGVDAVISTVHRLSLNGQPVGAAPSKNMARRKVWLSFSVQLQPGDKLEAEKLSTVHTSRDSEWTGKPYSLEKLQERSVRELEEHAAAGYETLFSRHAETWKKEVWDKKAVVADSDDPFDQLALRFSLYHLTVMAPAHDDRMGIGAKALSGEGYKGHSFWDTEIFILPHFLYADPGTAKSLLMYRFRGLEGARKKAKANGFRGAMYPWEMAWPSDGEVTPEWGDIDIVTGTRQKILSGLLEQHISADVAFAVWQYVNTTGDREFLEHCGYEMVFETADFWASRLEWDSGRCEYVITDVIGPDEYKEHVDNNAYTNWLAYFNLTLAVKWAEELAADASAQFGGLPARIAEWREKAEKLYLPGPRQDDSVIPQDDTYLQLPEIDLSKYKEQAKVRTIYRDYNAEQINGFQVTKQADTMLLFDLLGQTFLHDDPRLSEAAKRANFAYYEPRTLHDSSLSLATYAIAANDIGNTALAYSLFKKACGIDLGPAMDTSDEGIHAAAIGGIWKTAVSGFGGVRQKDGILEISPRLPAAWHALKFPLLWRGRRLTVEATKDRLSVSVQDGGRIEFESHGRKYGAEGRIELPLGRNLTVNR